MVAIPQVITEDRASGAQFIEGSLKFDSGKSQHLKRTYNSAGNRRFWTWSAWVKRGSIANSNVNYSLFGSYYNSSSRDVIRIGGEVQDKLSYQNGNAGDYDSSTTNAVLRDIGWYHFVVSVDLNQGTQTDRVKIYVNGELQSKSNDAQATRDSFINWKGAHFIGARSTDGTGSAFWDGGMSQVYFIDGQALGPEEFGYTDPLTNTWRPKKFEHLSTAITTQYSGASALTWDDNPIGSVYTLSNGNKTATASGGSGYTGADVWSNAIPANATTAFTLEITNSDGVGGWYFTDSQTPSGTHPDERGGNSLGMRNQDADAGWFGTFATANGSTSQGHVLPLLSCHTWGSKRVDFVVYRPASGNGKVWVKNNGSSTWVGGGNPSDTSSTPSFNIPDGDTYFGYTFYDRSNGDQIATLDGDGSIQQKLGPNSFYLPLDGNTPIGQDQSGKGNNWTPVNSGSVTLDNPIVSGAIPIHNTNDAGTVAKKGVRTDKKTYTVTASSGNYYLDGALKPILNAYRGGTYTFDYTGATSHPLYLSGMLDGKHNSKAYSVQFDGANGTDLQLTNHADLQVGSESNWTIEFFVRKTGAFADYDVITGKGQGGQFEWFIEGFANGQVRFLYSDNGSTTWTGDHILLQRMNDNQWYHFAAVRNGTSFKMYVDGVETFSTSGFNIHAGTGPLHIGGYGAAAGQDPPVQISNYRIVKGTSVYTSNFTRPGTTLENITNTKLLCCHDSSATTATVSPVSITSNGGVSVIQTHQPFLYIDSEGGVNTATSNTTKITIPHHAADTLYYYCNAHSGMGSSINVTTDIRKADPYAWKCVLANSLVGSANDVSNQINSGTTEKVMTVSGATANTASNFYGGSHKFVASSSQQITTPGSSNFAFGTGDFCVECWYYNDTSGGGTSYNQLVGNIESSASGFWRIGSVFGGGNEFWFTYTNGNYNDVRTSININDGRWHHLAATRQSGTLRLFVDGVVHATATVTHNFSSTATLRMMYSVQAPGYANGYLQDVRVFKGVAKYTENFAVGSTAPDVLPDTPSGITGKSKLTKVTEGAVTLVNSTDYLEISSSSDFAYGTGDFTIEAFVYLTQTPAANIPIVEHRTEGAPAANDKLGFFLRTPNNVSVYIDSANLITTADNSFSPRVWNHVAYCRSGGTGRIFINGVESGSATDSYNYGNARCAIGHHASVSSRNFPGSISNLRIVKGTALYTSDFTPPTEPLTAVTNTVLLCCQSQTSATATAVHPTATTNTRIPSGFSWWDAGATAGWNEAGSNTSGGNSDYVAVALPTSGKIYWETVVKNPATYRVIGVTDDGGNAPGNNGYQDNISGFYYNGNPPIYLAKRSGASSTSSQVTHGASTGTTWESGDIIMWAVDCGSSRMWIGRNGTWYASGNPAGGTNYAFHNMNVHTGGTYFKLAYATSSGGPATFEIKTEANSTLLADRGNAAATTFNPFTDDINAIRGQVSGYATLNPLNVTGTLSNGNLSFYRVAKGGTTSTIGVESGKIYVEAKGDVTGGGFGFGFVQSNYNNNGQTDIGDATNSFGIRATDSNITFKIQGATNTSISINSTSNTIFAYAVDFDTGLVNLLRDGVIIHSETLSLDSGTYYAAVASETGSATKNVHINFGQKPFKFPPPDDFQPLNLSNVQPEKVIARPDQYVGATLYTGSGDAVSSRTVELPHAADLVWAKSRDRASSHQLVDTVRGNNKVLISNSTDSERDPTSYFSGGGISTIDGKTITIASGTSSNANLNTNNNKGVVWSWKAGGSKNTFNIDDVGYANASDVNMNVGGLNSSAYDQSQTWSSFWSATGNGIEASNPATKSFDGVLTGLGMRLNGSSSCTWAPTGGYSYSGDFLIYACKDNDYTNVSWTVVHAGGTTDITNSVAAGTTMVELNLTNLGIQSPITSLSFTSNNNSNPRIAGMRAGGKLLVDSGVSVTNIPSIAATGCSVGTKQGFSIVKFNSGTASGNQSIPHKLDNVPSFIIMKSTSNSYNWDIYHKGISNSKDGRLIFTTAAFSTTHTPFGGVDPTSSVFTFNQSFYGNNIDSVAYLWCDVPGLQKFGTYTGNLSGDGPFIELGFRPAIVWVKRSDAAGEPWVIYDNSRRSINPNSKGLYANDSAVENDASARYKDFLSNGFKVRGTSGEQNTSGATYIYCAWAEAPTVNLYGGQANAR